MFKKKDKKLDESGEIIYFKGNYDFTRGISDGTWGKSKDEDIGNCSFRAISRIPATIELTIAGTKIEDATLRFNYKTLKLRSERDQKKGIEMQAIGHVDSCDLIYFISASDV